MKFKSREMCPFHFRVISGKIGSNKLLLRRFSVGRPQVRCSREYWNQLNKKKQKKTKKKQEVATGQLTIRTIDAVKSFLYYSAN